ncbi:hypothetical protein AYK25_07175 [Thermoplasmatales archaeon SM1-50]|nr:MAG: hypothetical protein AYK25_07175 [Thermoplasmatales archaeon SM1-50]
MSKSLLRKGIGIVVSLFLVLLVFSVLLPSASAIALSPGTPDSTLVIAGAIISFDDVTLTIRAAEAIPVKYLTYVIYNSENHHKVASVCFLIDGTEIFDAPSESFTVVSLTNTENLPYQSGGHYYGYDERTGKNVYRYRYGYGYGYGYGANDLTLEYVLSYTTCKPGTYYAKLFVKTQKHTYISDESILFTVDQRPPLSIYVDIKPGTIHTKEKGYLYVTIFGTNTFDVETINPKTLRLSLGGGKNIVKTPFWWYENGANQYLDLLLKFRIEQVIHVLKLFKHPDETLCLKLTGSLKKTEDCYSVVGSDFIQILTLGKSKGYHH